MGLFQPFDPEGRDIQEDDSPKTGLARLWEMVSRDWWDNFRAGFLAMLGCIPFCVGLSFSVLSRSLLFVPLLGLIGGAVAGPGLCGLMDTLLRGFRDDPSPWWSAYCRAWKRNAKESLLPGAMSGLLLAFQMFLFIFAKELELDIFTQIALAAGAVLLLGLSLYFWPQLVLMRLSFAQLLKNSALLFLGRIARSTGALAVLAAYVGLSVQFPVLTLVLLPFTNLWFPALLALFMIFPVLEDTFPLREQPQEESGGKPL